MEGWAAETEPVTIPEPIRLHYTDRPYRRWRRALPQQAELKPQGLWYSVGSEWADWCRAEEFGLPRLRCVYRVELNGANLLMLRTPRQTTDFTRRYETKLYGCHVIDWRRVAKQYDGIEINPYQHRLRFGIVNHLWYYGWDVASGCVWNPVVHLRKQAPPATG